MASVQKSLLSALAASLLLASCGTPEVKTPATPETDSLTQPSASISNDASGTMEIGTDDGSKVTVGVDGATTVESGDGSKASVGNDGNFSASSSGSNISGDASGNMNVGAPETDEVLLGSGGSVKTGGMEVGNDGSVKAGGMEIEGGSMKMHDSSETTWTMEMDGSSMKME